MTGKRRNDRKKKKIRENLCNLWDKKHKIQNLQNHPRPTGQNPRNIEIIEERLRTRENLCKSVKSVGLK